MQYKDAIKFEKVPVGDKIRPDWGWLFFSTSSSKLEGYK